jgi:hypothetical protein
MTRAGVAATCVWNEIESRLRKSDSGRLRTHDCRHDANERGNSKQPQIPLHPHRDPPLLLLDLA